MFQVVNGGTPTSEAANWEGGIVWITPEDLGGIDGGLVSSSRRTITESGVASSSARVSPAGSIVVSTRAPIGYVAELGGPAATNQGCRTLLPRFEVDARYFRYQLLSLRQELESRGQGSTFKELSGDDLADVTIQVPPVEEQRTIADFLDIETARIDKLMAAKRRLAMLLDERFHVAVIEAIGIDHQDRGGIRLGAVASVTLGRQRSPEHEFGPNMVHYLRAANVKDGRLELTDVKKMNFTPEDQAVFGLKPGDVLISEGAGSLAAVGTTAIWHGEIAEPICFQNTLLRLRPRFGMTPEYLAWWCRAAYYARLIAAITSGANIYHVSAERLKAVRCRLPTIEEQNRIAHRLSTFESHVVAITSHLQRQVEVLEERRQNVATHAIAGLVRAAAGPA